MHSNTGYRFTTSFILSLFGACLYCATMALHAADLSSGTHGQAAARSNLRLQFARSLTRPAENRTAPAVDDDLAFAEDCEEEDNAAPVMTVPYKAVVPAAAGHLSVQTNAALFAKAEPISRMNDVRQTENRPQASIESAPAAQVKKETLQTLPVPAAKPLAPSRPDVTWEIMPTDKTLNTALARWAAAAGWQLLWELPIDYAVETRTTVPGTFEEAIETVANSMASAETPMQAIFYKGNRVLRIVAKGSES